MLQFKESLCMILNNFNSEFVNVLLNPELQINNIYYIRSKRNEKLGGYELAWVPVGRADS